MIFDSQHPRPPVMSTLVVRVLEKPRVEIARGYESMEDFYQRVCDVAARYGGYVHQGEGHGRDFWLPFGEEPVDEC